MAYSLVACVMVASGCGKRTPPKPRATVRTNAPGATRADPIPQLVRWCGETLSPNATEASCTTAGLENSKSCCDHDEPANCTCYLSFTALVDLPLKRLRLENTHPDDLNELARIATLEEVFLMNWELDIEPLASLPELRLLRLTFWTQPDEKLEPIARSQVSRLELEYANVEDISILASSNVESLEVGDAPRGIYKMRNLRELIVNGGIHSFADLAAPNLESLVVYGGYLDPSDTEPGFNDVAPLAALNLKRLAFHGCCGHPIRLNALSSLATLEELDMSKSAVYERDLEALTKARPSLRILTEGTQLIPGDPEAIERNE